MKTEPLEMPAVTEEDVRAGEKSFPVRSRNGDTLTVRVRAVSWKTSLKALSLPPGESAIAFLQNCMAGDQARDSFLDTITPEHLVRMASVAMQLSSGTDALKVPTPTQQG
jgi:hypothetical protein